MLYWVKGLHQRNDVGWYVFLTAITVVHKLNLRINKILQNVSAYLNFFNSQSEGRKKVSKI